MNRSYTLEFSRNVYKQSRLADFNNNNNIDTPANCSPPVQPNPVEGSHKSNINIKVAESFTLPEDLS